MGSGAAPELSLFRAALDTSFQVQVNSSGPVELTLVEVAAYDRHPGWESFSLLFLGPRPAFPQATYVVDHTTIPSFELFLVPIESMGDEQRYEAVFIRPTA